MRAFVSAASIGGIWALIRTRIAISAARSPPRPVVGSPATRCGELGVGVREASIEASGRRASSPELLPAALGGEQPVGEREDLRRAPVVARERDLAGGRVARREAGQVVGRGAGERVDRLVLVADDADVLAIAEPQLQEALLERVRVLVLVDAEPALAGADGLGGVRVGLEQVDRLESRSSKSMRFDPRLRPLVSPKTRTNRSTGIGGSRRAA